MEKTYDVAVIGGGIAGMAVAYHAASAGRRVVLFERHGAAQGATVRNFGMIWPFGQPLEWFDTAMASRSHWLRLAEAAGFWAAPTGALCLAYSADELAVLEEFHATRRQAGYDIELLTPAAVTALQPAVRPEGLCGALFSRTEVNVDPRQATARLHHYLASALGVDIRYRTAVSRVEDGVLHSGRRRWRAEQVFVCSGADFETLYPEVFEGSGLRKCKLQMLRTVPQPDGWQLGPTLCAGLTLLHYGSFAHCATLAPLRRRLERELPQYIDRGIHLLVSQTSRGELVLGDSHAYDPDPDPFDSAETDRLILKYLSAFARLPDPTIAARWQGVYPKLAGKPVLVETPEPGVIIYNGLGGTGMTLSFGLAARFFQHPLAGG
ncbi:MAG: hypothetical protein RLY31_2836 [Bacteroidota bacterium]|jgi:FAD dependent oxidoreductase TIGR03364